MVSAHVIKRYKKILRNRRWQRRVKKFVMQARPLSPGASWHEYAANKPLSAAQVASFESRWGIQLPTIYAELLCNIGNGFAGPYFGISPIEEWAQPAIQDEMDDGHLSHDFDPEYPNQDCPPWGSMRISNAGCEHYYLLVVSGPHRGEIWHDGIVDGLGVRHLKTSDNQTLTFATWIDDWFIAVENDDWSNFNDEFWKNEEFPDHAVAQVLRDGAVELAADQLPCPSCISLLMAQRPVPRLVVTVASQGHAPLSNPKRAAMIAVQANDSSLVTSRQVFP
jgi:hypothetical protein